MSDYKNLYTESYLFAVGIDSYTDPILTPLGKAEDDARALCDLLTSKPFNFKSTILLGKQATRQAVLNALEELYDTDPDSRILFYFAGHGYTITDNFGHETGYLACADTVARKHHTALKLDEVMDARRFAKAKHIAFIFDSCFSGKALGMTTLRSAADRFLERRAYQVLSAGAGDQAVSDTRSMTRTLLDQLQATGKQEALRLNQVALAVQDRMATDTKSTQIPQFGHLAGSQGGDFMFRQAVAEIGQHQAVATFGRYEIVQEIAKGGMSTVYLARRTGFNRYVAIKKLPSQFLTDPQFEQRRDRISKLLTTIEHPSIVPVYDAGILDDQPYVVMRYLPGGTLRDRLSKEGALSLSTVLPIIAPVSLALDFAHSKGVIHQDMKPSNILFDEDGLPLISDFQMVNLVAESLHQLAGSSVLGTPTYLAPEVINKETLTSASDIYALGVIAYEMLAGEPPYQAATPMGVIMGQLNKPIPDICVRHPELPKGIALVFTKALAKRPEERYTTANDLFKAMQQATE